MNRGKDMIKQMIFAAAMFFVFGAVAGVVAQPASLEGKRWSLTEMNGKASTGSRAFIEFAEDGKRVSGNASCNRFFGGVSITGRTMKFSGMGSTRMFCNGLMEAEQEFLDAMKSVTRYRVRGLALTLYAGRKAVLPSRRSSGSATASGCSRRSARTKRLRRPMEHSSTSTRKKRVPAATRAATFLAATIRQRAASSRS